MNEAERGGLGICLAFIDAPYIYGFLNVHPPLCICVYKKKLGLVGAMKSISAGLSGTIS